MKIPVEATMAYHHTLVARLRQGDEVAWSAVGEAADLLEQYRLALLDIITDCAHRTTWPADRIFRIATHRGLGVPLTQEAPLNDGQLFA
jgi:hypothetical protein